MPEAPKERRWKTRDGLSLFARDYAAAGGHARFPIICLHGLTRNSRDFEDFAPWAAATGRRVLALDMRGRGSSDWDPKPQRYTPATYARDVVDLIDSLGIARAVFVGTSMGGIVTMALYAVRPRVVAAAVLNDVGPVVAPAGIERIKSYVGGQSTIRDWDDAREYAQRVNMVAFPDYKTADWDRFARRIFRETDGVPRLDYDPAIAVPLRQGRYKAPDFVAWHLFRRLARARPTLLVRGGRSDLLSEDIARRMERAAPGMRRVDVPGIGHAPMLSEPAAQNAIREFLAQVA